MYRYSGNVKISDNTVFLQGQDLDFIFFLLTRFNLKTLSFGTGQPLIKASELSNLELMFPKQVEENKQIAKFFNQVDNLITLHQREPFLNIQIISPESERITISTSLFSSS